MSPWGITTCATSTQTCRERCVEMLLWSHPFYRSTMRWKELKLIERLPTFPHGVFGAPLNEHFLMFGCSTQTPPPTAQRTWTSSTRSTSKKKWENTMLVWYLWKEVPLRPLFTQLSADGDLRPPDITRDWRKKYLPREMNRTVMCWITCEQRYASPYYVVSWLQSGEKEGRDRPWANQSLQHLSILYQVPTTMNLFKSIYKSLF